MQRAKRLLVGAVQEYMHDELLTTGEEMEWEEECETGDGEYDSNEDDGDDEGKGIEDLEENDESNSEIEITTSDVTLPSAFLRQFRGSRRLSYDSIDVDTPRKRSVGMELLKIIQQNFDEMDLCESYESGDEDYADKPEADTDNDCNTFKYDEAEIEEETDLDF